jgi:hypothetical protein
VLGGKRLQLPHTTPESQNLKMSGGWKETGSKVGFLLYTKSILFKIDPFTGEEK